jgi:hypothetical protein
MLVGETDFWSKAHRARSFRWDTGHVDASLVGHDGEGGDAPGANDRRRLFCRKYVSFCSKWVETRRRLCRALACILKFQLPGVKAQPDSASDRAQPRARERGDGRPDRVHGPDPGNGGELPEAGPSGRNVK